MLEQHPDLPQFYIPYYFNFVRYLILDTQGKQFLGEQFKDWGKNSSPDGSGLDQTV